MGIALRLSHSRIGDVTRLSFTVLVVIHVLISAWLVVDFEGQYTEGKPSPTNVNALIAVDNEKTLIDVEMENSTSFILYMLFRDYSEPEVESNQTENQSDDSTKTKDSGDVESKEWLKLGRNMVFITMILLIISEILVIIGIPLRATLRAFMWISLVASFAIVIPSTYVLDLVGDGDDKEDEEEDKGVTNSLSQETFVQSTETGSMAHEDNSIDSELVLWGVQFNMMFSGYDLGLVEPENYSAVREQPPEENSTDASSFVKFESNLKLKYGKNIPSVLLIPLAWFLLPAKPKVKPKQFLLESE
ncbi:MAG: hypothetical protein HON16_05210 [Euryarchaeota archaeon]|jgi:hypothetical protein|nr:hypothetical protein [Euryarchaeota archaeon]MBT4925131.1 hypothetical protein [Euryarchaeota archaeon]